MDGALRELSVCSPALLSLFAGCPRGTASACPLWGSEMLFLQQLWFTFASAARVSLLDVAGCDLVDWVDLVVASRRAFCRSCLQDRLSPITKSYPSKVILCKNELGWKERRVGGKPPKNPNLNILFILLDKIHLNFPSATVCSITWHTLARFLSLQLFSVVRKSASTFCNTSFGYWSDNQMYLWGIWVWNKAICYKTLVLTSSFSLPSENMVCFINAKCIWGLWTFSVMCFSCLVKT